jgi:hypothetical protein
VHHGPSFFQASSERDAAILDVFQRIQLAAANTEPEMLDGMSVPGPLNGAQRKSKDLAVPVVELREASRIGAAGNHRRTSSGYPWKL